MTAATKARLTDRYGTNGELENYPMKGAVIILAGTLCALDASGFMVPVTSVATLQPKSGMKAKETIDTTGLADGVKKIEAELGVWGWENSAAADQLAQTDVGNAVYGVDNQTVAKTDGGGTRSIIGTLVRIEGGQCFVRGSLT